MRQLVDHQLRTLLEDPSASEEARQAAQDELDRRTEESRANY